MQVVWDQSTKQMRRVAPARAAKQGVIYYAASSADDQVSNDGMDTDNENGGVDVLNGVADDQRDRADHEHDEPNNGRGETSDEQGEIKGEPDKVDYTSALKDDPRNWTQTSGQKTRWKKSTTSPPNELPAPQRESLSPAQPVSPSKSMKDRKQNFTITFKKRKGTARRLAPLRVGPVRAAKERSICYSDSPDGVEAEDGDHRTRTDGYGPSSGFAFEDIKAAIRGGLAKPASEIPNDRACFILGRCIADPDFYVITDGTAQYAVELAEVSDYVASQHIALFENAVFTYQDQILSMVKPQSRMSEMYPESALRKFTHAAWVLPMVCGKCDETFVKPSYKLAPHGPSPGATDQAVAQPPTSSVRDVYVGDFDETDSSSSDDDDDGRPKDKRDKTASYTCRIKSLEGRLAAAQDFAQARSSKSLMNDRRKIKKLEREVESLRQRLRRHDDRELMLESTIAQMRGQKRRRASGLRAELKYASEDETEDELASALKSELIRAAKRQKIEKSSNRQSTKKPESRPTVAKSSLLGGH